MRDDPALPGYTDPAKKRALLAAGASGTIYSLVMPESEAALARVIDGCDRAEVIGAPDALAQLDAARRTHYLSRYHEPWMQKQDAMHVEYFDRWLAWSAPVVTLDAPDFPHRYPTAGASEGIFKLIAEYAAACRLAGRDPALHLFEGEYEGFPAYAAALGIPVTRHVRDAWREVPARIEPHAQFWLSQPSAIDGNVWDDFEPFAARLERERPEVALIPDLTYVGSVARDFAIDLRFANIPAFVISHSKPFGGYYHRVGGVFARTELPSLFGNKWFKNLQSLAWGVEMMQRHAVHDLPRRYRPVQEAAATAVAKRLDLPSLRPADVMLLGIAEPFDAMPDAVAAVVRGSGSDRVIRLCLTPTMTAMIDPAMAPGMAHLTGTSHAD